MYPLKFPSSAELLTIAVLYGVACLLVGVIIGVALPF